MGFGRSGWPEAAAKVVDNLEAHIHTAATNLESVTAGAVGEACSVADVPGDVADGVAISNKDIQPARHAAGRDVSQGGVDNRSRLEQCLKHFERFALFSFGSHELVFVVPQYNSTPPHLVNKPERSEGL